MPCSLLTLLLGATIGMQLEAGVGHFVNRPQSDYFGWGESVAVRADLGLLGPLAAQVSGTFINVANVAPFLKGPGRVVQAGVGPKLRLLDLLTLDAQVLIVGTGPYLRFAWDVGLGLAFVIKELVTVGPFVRFQHIVQPDGTGVDGADAALLHFGLSVGLRFETGPARDRPSPVVPEPRVPEPETPQTTISVKKATDLDGDGIPDPRDGCPGEAEVFNGVDDSDGCPDPEKALVKLTSAGLEVVTPVRFEKGTRVDQGGLQTVGTLARVLALHPELKRVRLEYAEPSVELARRRADALVQLLVDAGLPAERLEALGVQGKSGRLEVRVLERE